MLKATILFDFNGNADIQTWQVVNDVVMGGRSSSSMTLNDEGNGVFQGQVSLENNGGFASIRHALPSRDISSSKKFVIRLKGDGKKYQFRVKENLYDYHSFITYFETTGDWQIIDIPFDDMYPSFRGRKLDRPNFPGKNLEELGFLVGNKTAENFRIEIDKIELR